MAKGQVDPQLALTIIVVVAAAVLVVAFFWAKSGAESKPVPGTISASYGCNVEEFGREYNITNAYPMSIVYNGQTYHLLTSYSSGQTVLIRDFDCSLEQEYSPARDVFSYSLLSSYLSKREQNLYRNLAICYGVAAGSRPICSITTATKDFFGNPVVQAAKENEKASVSIVTSLAPNGWKKTAADSTKNLVTITKEIEGPNAFSLAFNVADTTACYMKDSIGASIYDYALTIGDDLWYKMRARDTYTGMDTDLRDVNRGLEELMANPDWQASVSNVVASLLDGTKKCDYDARTRYTPELQAINGEIDNCRTYGDNAGRQYAAWVKGIKDQADFVRMNTTQLINPRGMYSLGGTVEGIFFVTKIGDYLDARAHYASAESFYQRGLFYSSQREYSLLAASWERWHGRRIIDSIAALIFWLVIIIVLVLILLAVFG